MDNIATAFVDTQAVDYAAVAKTVVNMKPRALTPPQFEDVLTLLEWMQQECVRMHEHNEQRAAHLAEREQQIIAREKELRIRARTIDVASMTKTAGSRFARYLRG